LECDPDIAEFVILDIAELTPGIPDIAELTTRQLRTSGNYMAARPAQARKIE
jgi:hypothetical protein